jgi:hypothetical protein
MESIPGLLKSLQLRAQVTNQRYNAVLHLIWNSKTRSVHVTVSLCSILQKFACNLLGTTNMYVHVNLETLYILHYISPF